MFRARLQAARARVGETAMIRALPVSLPHSASDIIGAIAEPGNYDHATGAPPDLASEKTASRTVALVCNFAPV